MVISTNKIDLDFLTPKYMIYGEFKDTIRNIVIAPTLVHHIFSGNSNDKCKVLNDTVMLLLGFHVCSDGNRGACMSLCLSLSLTYTYAYIFIHILKNQIRMMASFTRFSNFELK